MAFVERERTRNVEFYNFATLFKLPAIDRPATRAPAYAAVVPQFSRRLAPLSPPQNSELSQRRLSVWEA
jgi:hypothetical protein